MKLCWRFLFGATLCLGMAASSGGTPPKGDAPTAGFLIHPGEEAQPAGKPHILPYQPRAGDIVLYDTYNKFHYFVYKVAGTSAPIHASMVIERPDGTPAMLELTGPHVITAKVCILDVEPRLANYPGSIIVRRIREPLTHEQKQELYCFAEAQVGKSFAVGRIILQGSPLSVHSGLRRELFGRTYFNRNRWYCSELVVAAGTKASLFNPRVMPANGTYPRDLAYDEMIDLSPLYHSALPWVADRAAVVAAEPLNK